MADDDKRLEAMHRAIEEADAGRSKVSSAESNGRSHRGSLKIGSFFGNLTVTKTGKFVIGGVALVLVGILIAFIYSAVAVSPSSSEASYQITNSVICGYQTPNAVSGYGYDAYIEILNTGSSPIYIKDPEFLVAAKAASDPSGKFKQIIDTKDITVFPAVIAPGEKGYMYNRFGEDLGDQFYDPNSELALAPSFTIMKANAMPQSYPVSEVYVERLQSGGQKLTAQVENNTDKNAGSIAVFAVVYNADGYVIGIGNQFLTDVAAHTSSRVNMESLNMIYGFRNDQVADYVTYAY